MTLLNHWVSSLASFASHIANVRGCLKTVRAREEALGEMRNRRKSLVSKADSTSKRLGKMNPENKNLRQQTDLLVNLRDQIRTLDVEIMDEEASLGDWKRVKAREWMGVLFGGLLECSEKGSVVATFGHAIVGCVPTEETRPGLPRTRYSGHSQVERLLKEAELKLQKAPGDVSGLSPSPPSLSIRQTPTQPTQPYASTTLPNNPPSDLYGLSDFGEYSPYLQSQSYAPGQRVRLSSLDQSPPASPTGFSPFAPFPPQEVFGFTARHQPSLSAGQELRGISFVSGAGDGILQSPGEFRVADTPGLSPSPPSLPTRPSTHQLTQKPATTEKNIVLGVEFGGHPHAACDTGEIVASAPEMQDADRCVAERPSPLYRGPDRSVYQGTRWHIGSSRSLLVPCAGIRGIISRHRTRTIRANGGLIWQPRLQFKRSPMRSPPRRPFPRNLRCGRRAGGKLKSKTTLFQVNSFRPPPRRYLTSFHFRVFNI